MNIVESSSRIIITCNKWLAPYLEREVRELGFKIVRLFQTGVELNGTIRDCIRLNLNLRCASQVLYSIKAFVSNGPDDVYREIKALPWEEIIPVEGYFSITSNVSHPTITNSMFANVKVKDAIVDRIRDKTGSRPNTGPSLEQTVVHLFWREQSAEIFIDTAGETLAKHGYRKIPGRAPMLEALAASTILATTWNRNSPFINPMCGSGTVAIEAALIATNRRPGLFRNNYGFMHLQGYSHDYYQQEKQLLTTQIISRDQLEIIATDISEDAVGVSKMNAAAAGVDHLIKFDVCDYRDTGIPPQANGVIYFNPEYGERLGEEAELEITYAEIGDFLKDKCKGYTGYIFTGNLELAKKIGLKPKRRIEFYTSKIDCRLFEYELYSGTRRTDKVLA